MIKNIKPVTVFPNTATKLRVDDCLVTLDESVNVQWALLDNNSNVLGAPGRLTFSGEDYENWGSDDDYLFNLVASALSLTVIPDEDSGE